MLLLSSMYLKGFSYILVTVEIHTYLSIVSFNNIRPHPQCFRTLQVGVWYIIWYQTLNAFLFQVIAMLNVILLGCYVTKFFFLNRRTLTIHILHNFFGIKYLKRACRQYNVYYNTRIRHCHAKW